jgi:hypothetical protein
MSVFVDIFNKTFGDGFRDSSDEPFVEKCFKTWSHYGKKISFEDVITTILADAIWGRLGKPSPDDKYCWFGESIECFLMKANIEEKDDEFKGKGDNSRYIKPDLSFINGNERVIVEIKSPSRGEFSYPKKDIERLARIKAAHNNISTYLVIMNDAANQEEWGKGFETYYSKENIDLLYGQKVSKRQSIVLVDNPKVLTLHLFEIG